MARFVGYATVSPDVGHYDVLYPFGPLSDVAGKRLPVLERNPDGDCLCLVGDGVGIADVAEKAIVKFERGG